MDSVRELLKSEYHIDSISIDILFDHLKTRPHTIVEINNELYARDHNKALYPLNNVPHITNLIKSLNDMQNGNFSNCDQNTVFKYLFGKIRLLENELESKESVTKNIHDGPKSVIKQVSQTIVQEPMIKYDYKHYQTICEKIVYDNQYYHLILVNKKTREFANYKFCQYQPMYNVFGAHNPRQIKNEYVYGELKSYYDANGYFELFDNEYFAIRIIGIKEPNVYEVIDQIKEKYGL